MGKRKVLASDFGLRKCAKREQPTKDQISRLPNEILVYVLSLLTVKEAARTTVLSKRWIDLWMYVDRLNFDASEVLEKISQTFPTAKFSSCRKRERRERCRYVEWVNKALQSHKSLALDDFRVAFCLDKSSGNEIDKWLQYAFSRRVQRLELDLSLLGESYCPPEKSYTFPYAALGLSNEKSLDKSQLPGYGDIYPHRPIDFKALRTLTFKGLNVSREVLEFFLHECPVLERLVVRDSSDLTKLEVCGPSLALKYLEICDCCDLLSITVRDTNLISLKIDEGQCLVLQNVPMLVDVWFTGLYPNFVRGVVSCLSCCLSKLEFLTLFARMRDVPKQKGDLPVLPSLTNLKEFTLIVSISKDDTLMGFTSLIRASPNLEKVVLKLWWGDDDDMVRGNRELKKGIRFPLQRLKVVELLGYHGRRSELELVEYFLENAVVLEKIIIDPRDQPTDSSPKTRKEIKQEKVAKKYAKQQLEGMVPSHVELVIQ